MDKLDLIQELLGTSLAVQCLGLCASTAGDTGSIPGQGTKIPHAPQRAPAPHQKRIVGCCDLGRLFSSKCYF